MIPVRDVIVKVDRAYENAVVSKSGFSLLLNESIKQVKNTVRFGIIVNVPDDVDVDVRIGDKLYFHHNIVGVTTMEEGNDIDSHFVINKEEGLYRVPIDKQWMMMYAVERDGETIMLDGVCFIKPLYDKKFETSVLYIPDNEVETLHIGEVLYPSNDMNNMGITKGTRVVFDKDSEYRYKINGEWVYCMFDRWILGVL